MKLKKHSPAICYLMVVFKTEVDCDPSLRYTVHKALTRTQ
jgi:hypothetical protein